MLFSSKFQHWRADCCIHTPAVSCARLRHNVVPTSLQRFRHLGLCKTASTDDYADLQEESQFEMPFDRVVDQDNISPNYQDPNWDEKVTNWEQFWYHDWDGTEQVYDERDAYNPEVGMASIERAKLLMDSIHDAKKREHMVHILGPAFQGQIFNSWEHMPTDPLLPKEVNPQWHYFDYRAMVEKQRKKQILDAEWRRRQALVGRVPVLSNSTDVRMLAREPEKENWTHEEVMELITGGGKYAHPDDVQVNDGKTNHSTRPLAPQRRLYVYV